MKRVLLDANVLFPANLRNTLMHLALAEAFAARWTNQIHDEWTRNVLAKRPDLTAHALERTRRLMDENVLDALVEGFEPLIETLSLPDANDRHVLAAAIHSSCDVILTWNLKDFPRQTLSLLNIEARDPDDFLTALWPDERDNILDGLRTHRASLYRPPHTSEEFLAMLKRQNLTRFAAALAPFHESL